MRRAPWRRRFHTCASWMNREKAWSWRVRPGDKRQRERFSSLDADCRAPLQWLERIERRFARDRALAALSVGYRFYDWDQALSLCGQQRLPQAAPPVFVEDTRPQRETWPAIKLALRNNVDIALTLFRKDSWAA